MTAAIRLPLEAMLATCEVSLEGLRDRALLLFAWASGGPKRSKVASARVEQLTKVDEVVGQRQGLRDAVPYQRVWTRPQ
jgi:hypothetical protein